MPWTLQVSALYAHPTHTDTYTHIQILNCAEMKPSFLQLLLVRCFIRAIRTVLMGVRITRTTPHRMHVGLDMISSPRLVAALFSVVVLSGQNL